MKNNKKYTNHVNYILDGSGSMSHLKDEVVKLFDNQIRFLVKKSKEMDQETRVSVYLFSNNDVKCLVWDSDCLRLPSIENLYYTNGNTNLIDATLKSIEDLKLIPELYTDHAFITFLATDGAENSSNHTANDLSNVIKTLKDNWTLAILVPDQSSANEAKKHGFPVENISIWDTTSAKGVEEVSRVVISATDTFFQNRAVGIRGTKNLFKVNVAGVSSDTVRDSLDALPKNNYEILNVDKDSSISDFIISKVGMFAKGKGFYELTKPETVQGNKSIIIQNRISKNLYSGVNARKLLGLPDYEIRVSPENFGNYKIFVQSNSSNRKLLKKTQLVVLK